MDIDFDAPEKQCMRCKEFWPPDEEFYRPGHNKCIACEYELRNQTPSRAAEARNKESDRSKRRREVAAAARKSPATKRKSTS